jgi:hypothetical protein
MAKRIEGSPRHGAVVYPAIHGRSLPPARHRRNALGLRKAPPEEMLHAAPSRRQLIKQRLRLLQIARVEPSVNHP